LQWYQWHPFSISSAPSGRGEAFTLHIQKGESGQFTAKLLQQAASLKGKAVLVDGPYESSSLVCSQFCVFRARN